MKRYNHIPKHLLPVRIPKLRVKKETSTLPSFLKKHLYSMIGLVLLPVIGLDSEASGSEE